MDGRKFQPPEQGKEVYGTDRAPHIKISLKELPVGMHRRDMIWIPLIVETQSKQVDSEEQRSLVRALQGLADRGADGPDNKKQKLQVAPHSMPTVVERIDIPDDSDPADVRKRGPPDSLCAPSSGAGSAAGGKTAPPKGTVWATQTLNEKQSLSLLGHQVQWDSAKEKQQVEEVIAARLRGHGLRALAGLGEASQGSAPTATEAAIDGDKDGGTKLDGDQGGRKPHDDKDGDTKRVGNEDGGTKHGTAGIAEQHVATQRYGTPSFFDALHNAGVALGGIIGNGGNPYDEGGESQAPLDVDDLLEGGSLRV